LNDKYEKWINNYKEGKLLILDKDTLDFANKPEDLGLAIEKITAEINGLF
jgi:deoxyadenosine/deoxycytidine kinase